MNNATHELPLPGRLKGVTRGARGKMLLAFDFGKVEQAQVIIGDQQIDMSPGDIHGTLGIDVKLLSHTPDGCELLAPGIQPILIGTYAEGVVFAVICGPGLRKPEEPLSADELAEELRARIAKALREAGIQQA
jgi:hypothetical protein